MTKRTLAAAALGMLAMTAFVTWPQALHFTTDAASHDDPLFTMWRLEWFAHALLTSPAHLLDANILYPAERTFTFADMTIVEAAIAAPFLWLHVPPVVVYNFLIFLGFAGSGVGAFVLARHLTRDDGAALVAAAIFTMAPYRVEHFMHLELQWAAWIPLALWALHRAIDEGSWRMGALAGLFVALQIGSCVYYGIFLAVFAVIVTVMLLLTAPRRVSRAIAPLAAAGFVAAVLVIPYLIPYLATSRSAAPRDPTEVAAYSALPVSYLTSPPQNWLWGWTSARWGHPELSLYPGVAAALLAIVGLFARPRRLALIYAVVAVTAFELSLGSHGSLYPLIQHVSVIGNLRSPSRFAIVVECAIAVLAALGVSSLRGALSPLHARLVPLAALVLVTIDFANTGMYLSPVPAPNASTVYRAVRSSGPGPVIELPMPVPEALPGHEAVFQYWSTAHWHPLVNGYTAVYTDEYIYTLDRMRTFPDDRSILQLQRLGVRYVIVHRAFYEPGRYTALMVSMGNRPELRSLGAYRDPIGEAQLFVLR